MERFAPTSLGELEAIVAAALAAGRSLEIIGAGTKRGLGRPLDVSAVLATTGLAGVDMYEPEELVMSAGAGTPLAEIEAMLAERRQELAFEPADYGAILGGAPGRQTIGGVFACNLAGPRRLKAGAARDHLLGLACVTGYGKAVKAGGRVVKNVTGYDLCKLLTGSLGTLAVLSHVTFKVLPAAEHEATLLVSGTTEADLLGVLRAAMGTAYDVSAAALLPARAAARSAVPTIAAAAVGVACLRLEGPAPSVTYRAERLEVALNAPGRGFARLAGPADSRCLWREIRDVALLDRARPLWRLSMPPAAAARLLPELETLGAERLHDWAGGLVWLAPDAVDPTIAARLRAMIQRDGGHATLIRAPAEARSSIEPFHPPAPTLRRLTERVKASFDPQRILNPGRIYAGL